CETTGERPVGHSTIFHQPKQVTGSEHLPDCTGNNLRTFFARHIGYYSINGNAHYRKKSAIMGLKRPGLVLVFYRIAGNPFTSYLHVFGDRHTVYGAKPSSTRKDSAPNVNLVVNRVIPTISLMSKSCLAIIDESADEAEHSEVSQCY